MTSLHQLKAVEYAFESAFSYHMRLWIRSSFSAACRMLRKFVIIASRMPPTPSPH
jgi:hypothetical protein